MTYTTRKPKNKLTWCLAPFSYQPAAKQCLGTLTRQITICGCIAELRKVWVPLMPELGFLTSVHRDGQLPTAGGKAAAMKRAHEVVLCLQIVTTPLVHYRKRIEEMVRRATHRIL